ncbi:uncharacterized protein LOC131936546 [Physella acuta]|uniref:uncharacterized protein LOC131936546 n=1 Tax=Physella acuta TaxID=109671 RepID=UPI0027DB3BD3|nr:uncharacterized protein LOC131936546 [Physella acuta]
MSTIGHQAVGGLEAIENGLKFLRRSQLMIVPEFKNMYGAIEKHHNDLKFAHLTGIAKDLQEQAVRDTKFYNILTKMLCEVKQKRSNEQRAGLRQIYIWYMANKHVLYCGPHFGKELMKEEAKKILLKASTPRPTRNRVNQEKADAKIVQSGLVDENITQFQEKITTVSNENLTVNGGVEDEDVNMETSQEKDEKNVINDTNIHDVPSTPPLSQAPISVTISNLKERLNTQPGTGMSRVTTMIHPIPSLVNPHVQFDRQLSTEETAKDKRAISARVKSASRPERLQAWQAYMKNRSYGQDIIGTLSFGGRSGTPLDVRYSSHSQAEFPEAHTRDQLREYVKILNSPDTSPRSMEDEETIFMQQTLEEFYQTADSMRPTTRNMSRMSARAKSAPCKTPSKPPGPVPSSAKQFRQVSKLGHQLSQNQENDLPDVRSGPDTGVKLNMVVTAIDTVKDGMNYYREKVLTPQPQYGFRQPSVTGFITPRETISSVDSGLIQDITNTPQVIALEQHETSRPQTTPNSSFTRIDDAVHTPVPSKPTKQRCKSAGVDWRGKIQPDTVRYKWSKTKFGCHTYLKKWYKPNQRTSGTTSAGKRPKTAPITTQEKWKTQKESDKNTRPVQAASHSTTLMDQNVVDNMVMVQHLLPGEDGIDFMDSIYDHKFWKNIRKSSVSQPSELPKEFLTFVAPTTSAEKTGLHKPPASDGVKQESESAQVNEKLPEESTNTLQTSYNEDALNIATKELYLEDSFSQDFSYNLSAQKDAAESVDVSVAVPDQQESIIEATQQGRQSPSSSLTQSNFSEWILLTEQKIKNRQQTRGPTDHHFSEVHLEPEETHQDLTSHMKSTKVERSAGRMPYRVQSASAQMQGYTRRCNDTLRKVPPLRTPPSIPSPQLNAKNLERKNGQIFVELEHHARRTKSPRSFMNKIEGLRCVDSPMRPSVPSYSNNDPILGTSLQVCKLPIPRKTNSSQYSSHLEADFSHRNVYHGEHAFNGNLKHNLYEKQVTFLEPNMAGSYEFLKPTSAPSLGPPQSLESSEHSSPRNSMIHRSPKGTTPEAPSSPRSTSSSRSVAKIGRPIAQVQKVPDPDDVLQAVQLQKEAAAAVDIQRIFRGFVARNVYKSLLSEEIRKKEEKQKAAIRIQRTYRDHLVRKNAIYHRPQLSPEIVQWSKELKEKQSEKATQRQVKLENLANELNTKEKESKSKLQSIGPHVDIYSIYHPKKIGPTMKELHQAATKIQKIVRGWLVRRRIEKLSRKATWYGSNFTKMVKEYKNMLKAVQSQHGVDKPKSPFSIKEFNSYIDTRRRYESVFEKKAFGGELELSEVPAFFKECDLYPSQEEIDEAMDVTLHGQAIKRENQGLKKKELLDMVFYIYVPPATSLKGTRQSTWMNPIIDGQEARKLLGSEFVEPAPLAPCAKLVIDAKREQRKKEQALQEAEERKRIEESKQRAEEKKAAQKVKHVTIQSPKHED